MRDLRATAMRTIIGIMKTKEAAFTIPWYCCTAVKPAAYNGPPRSRPLPLLVFS